MPSFMFLTNVLSPHQLPLAREIVARLGEGNYRYCYTDELEAQRVKMGWQKACSRQWCTRCTASAPHLAECDMLLSGLRAMETFERRLANGRLTCYVSERWFKPPIGFLRILSPAYFQMARRFVQYLDSPHFHYFPQGIHAARDMMRLQGLLHGDLRCLFQAPKVAFEAKPGGRIIPLRQAVQENLLRDRDIAFGRRHGFIRIPPERWAAIQTPGPWHNYHLWGYFVAPSEKTPLPPKTRPSRKILWVGRMLDWKRIGTLIRALPNEMELDLHGHGPEEQSLKNLAHMKKNIRFHDYVPIVEIRRLMREHDLYVLPSDGGEGWGAVLNEAMEEGMSVLASIESGAGATMLEPEMLFPAKDAHTLRRLLTKSPRPLGIRLWGVSTAADYLLDFFRLHARSPKRQSP